MISCNYLAKHSLCSKGYQHVSDASPLQFPSVESWLDLDGAWGNSGRSNNIAMRSGYETSELLTSLDLKFNVIKSLIIPLISRRKCMSNVDLNLPDLGLDFPRSTKFGRPLARRSPATPPIHPAGSPYEVKCLA